jgi:tungstate transport system ATP-binding protein
MENERDITNSFPILEARDLQVTRGGIPFLEVPSFQIGRGEILSLIGPNGAGKTTLLLTLSHLTKRVSGEILFHGKKVGSDFSIFEYRRRLAMVFQEPLLFDTTVYNNVASGLKIRNMDKGEIRRTVLDHLDRFGITQLIDRSARTLSGGEAQRASLARAFAIKPEILLLDEPFAALDPPTRESLVEDLDRALRESGTTALFATHDRMEALRLSDHIAVMNQGRIIQIGPPEEVMNRPVDEFVAGFVGVETILSGKVIRKEGGGFIVSVSGKEIETVGEVPSGETVALCIRPENVTLSAVSSKETTSARNVFQGRIVKLVSMEFFAKVSLDCGFPLVAYITRHSLEDLGLEEGKEVKASFKATAIHVVRRKGK